MASGSAVTLESGLKLSYADQGTRSDPVVLLLPGPTDSWRSYEPVLDRLPSEVRVIAVSQRGHGDSDKPEGGYSVGHFAADVVSLLDALGVERAVLAGHSGTCLVARRVALDHPERVAGLILEASPTTLRGHAGLTGFVESVVSGLEDPISPEFAQSVVNDTSSERVAPELRDLLVEELLKVPARVWRAMFADLLRLRRHGRAEPHRRSPAVLLWGDGDALVSQEMQDQLVSSHPRYQSCSSTPASGTPHGGKIRHDSTKT